MYNNLAILIINRNDYENTSVCIQSLLDHSGGQDFSVILLDNHSHDGSKNQLIQQFRLQEITPSNWDCEENDIFQSDNNFAQYS